ncbi:hypothetical protein SAMN05444336_1011220 [Albimonas donghaensis]|uniref:IraD/Gp25-like domain-containing protein n=1 Tax=Albimonas donghaensis TaxID=356660 RepID=A0A1H2U5H6_9RHOB|nr:GPW/gp25 family protein [Albimonas donghaensis]MAS44935.1 phage tail protein [Paracoccaceae bacterium]MBR26034.1 phage tail protein [Paracoccaceae bacterium]SDW51197.1 hypothetical protein SAMN05444336_1011220 [Albimonas donghaensis]
MTATGRALGRGIAFPPRIDEEGRMAWSEGVENIRESIRIILTTERLERVMLPAFGAGLKRFLFRPDTAATHRLIEEAIAQTLKRWERRIEVESVRVETDPRAPQAVLATLRYRLVRDGSREEMRLGVQLG